jgi:predicted dehydrogenase
MPEPFRGILAGLGVMGSYHLRVLSSHPDAVVAGVVDPDPDRRALAQRAAGAPAFATLTEALASVRPDFACLAAPVDRLPDLCHETLAAGVAVLVEKPMAPTEGQAVEMVRDAERRGTILGVGHVERCNPAVIALKGHLEQGRAGRVYQVHARRLSPLPDRESMLGVALDLATHDLDVLRHLTGAEVARVYAETAERTPVGREDLLSASLRLDNDITGVLEVNWLTPAKVRELTVTAEGGMYAVDYLTQDLCFYENPRARIEWDALRMVRGTGEGNMTRYALERREPLRVQWDAFLTALADGSAPAATGWDGVAALSIARAIQRSGQDNLPVVPAYRTRLGATGGVPEPAGTPAG